MSRPKPEVLLDCIDSKTFVGKQVLRAQKLYVVLYDGQPFNLRSYDHASNRGPFKYRRLGFAAIASADNSAKKLNKMHGTDKFAAYEVNITACKKVRR